MNFLLVWLIKTKNFFRLVLLPIIKQFRFRHSEKAVTRLRTLDSIILVIQCRDSCFDWTTTLSSCATGCSGGFPCKFKHIVQSRQHNSQEDVPPCKPSRPHLSKSVSSSHRCPLLKQRLESAHRKERGKFEVYQTCYCKQTFPQQSNMNKYCSMITWASSTLNARIAKALLRKPAGKRSEHR